MTCAPSPPLAPAGRLPPLPPPPPLKKLPFVGHLLPPPPPLLGFSHDEPELAVVGGGWRDSSGADQAPASIDAAAVDRSSDFRQWALLVAAMGAKVSVLVAACLGLTIGCLLTWQIFTRDWCARVDGAMALLCIGAVPAVPAPCQRRAWALDEPWALRRHAPVSSPLFPAPPRRLNSHASGEKDWVLPFISLFMGGRAVWGRRSRGG